MGLSLIRKCHQNAKVTKMEMLPKLKCHQNWNIIFTLSGCFLTKFGFVMKRTCLFINKTKLVPKTSEVLLNITEFSLNTTKYKCYYNYYDGPNAGVRCSAGAWGLAWKRLGAGGGILC